MAEFNFLKGGLVEVKPLGIILSEGEINAGGVKLYLSKDKDLIACVSTTKEGEIESSLKAANSWTGNNCQIIFSCQGKRITVAKGDTLEELRSKYGVQ